MRDGPAYRVEIVPLAGSHRERVLLWAVAGVMFTVVNGLGTVLGGGPVGFIPMNEIRLLDRSTGRTAFVISPPAFRAKRIRDRIESDLERLDSAAFDARWRDPAARELFIRQAGLAY